MVINWFSSSRVSGRNAGFVISWGTKEAGCGNQLIQKESGKFTSPNYPSNYPAETECKWVIQTKPGNHLVFNSLYFRLPDRYPSGECEDSLAFIDYDDTEIDTYCGYDTLPNPIETSRNRATALFISHKGGFKGFEIEWSTKCGEMLKDATEGVIHNQNYGIGPYAPDIDCSWFITPKSPYDLVNLRVIDIDIAGSVLAGCGSDYLAFYKPETSDGSSSLIKKLCGNLGDKVSSRGEMRVRFVTGSEQNGHMGWRAEYSVGGCGGYQLAANGSIDAHAHDLDGLQEHSVNCTWVLEAVGTEQYSEMAIIGEWEYYHIGVTPGCAKDYLRIYDGSSTSARLIDTYCGSIPPPMVKSTSKFLTFELITSNLSTGFKFDWIQTLGPAQGCGGTVAQHSGSISSPQYPAEYLPNLLCIWEFIPQPPQQNQGLSLDFTHFELEERGTNGRCADYVEVYESSDLHASVIFGPECGNLGKFTVKSPTDQNQKVVFVSDGTNEAGGFQIQYKYYQLNCGGELIANDQIQDLHYRYASEDKNSDCIYNIRTSADHYVHIIPQMIHFPESTSEYKTPITKQAQNTAVLMLDGLNSHHASNIILSVSQTKADSTTYILLCPTSADNSECWKFVINIENQNRITNGGMTVTQRTFNDNSWNNWQKSLEIRLTDRSIGLFHQGVEILFHQSDSNFPILKHDLDNLLVANDGVGGARFVINSVRYRHNKNEVSLLNKEYQVVTGRKIAELPRFYKLFSFQTEIYIDEDPDANTWKNIVNIGHEAGSYATCGDRMPLISINKGTKLGLHISACVNGNLNYNINTDVLGFNMERKVWYQVEVGQNYENGAYTYYIMINGQILRKEINTSPVDFNDKEMSIWASINVNPPGKTAENTKVRNMRFTTEPDGDSDWFVIDGEDCWKQCDYKAGKERHSSLKF